MLTKNKRLIIAREDYQTLHHYINEKFFDQSFDRKNALLLKEELNKARVVKQNDLPGDVVRLNSKVKIREATSGKLLELMLVLPEKANIRENKISVFAPLGTALIGFPQGKKISWSMPAGSKTFTILEVNNQ